MGGRVFRALVACLILTGAEHGWAQAGPAVPEPPTTCLEAVASVAALNAIALRAASGACAEAGRIEDANFLYAIAQLRGIADFTLLPPLDLSDEDGYNISLWLYYGATSVGIDEFYRTPENVTALEERIRSVELTLADGYDPGWTYRPTTKAVLYPRLIDSIREEQLWQRRRVALLMQDDAYYAAFMAEQAFNERLREAAPTERPGAVVTVGPGIAPGTPEYDEIVRLLNERRRAAEGVPEPPRPVEDRELVVLLNQPEPHLAAMQVAIGFNAPELEPPAGAPVAMPDILRSPEDVRQSWLASALGEADFARLLETDFSRQVLIVMTLGAQINASGNIALSEFALEPGDPARGWPAGYQLRASVGVMDATCNVPLTVARPFIVVVAEAAPGAGFNGWGRSTYVDACGPPVGVPITELAGEGFVPEMGRTPDDFARAVVDVAGEAEQQLAAGFNGPAEEGTLVLRSAEAVRQSWLPEALDADELGVLLAHDFAKEALVVYSLGRRTNLSGTLILFELFHDEGFPAGTNAGYWVSVRIGIVPETCTQATGAEAFPFVVGRVTDAREATVINQSFAAFADVCREVMVGTPVD